MAWRGFSLNNPRNASSRAMGLAVLPVLFLFVLADRRVEELLGRDKVDLGDIAVITGGVELDRGGV